MKKILLFITIVVMLSVFTTACKNNEVESKAEGEEIKEMVEYSLNEIVERNRATKGENFKIMRVDTSFQNTDGSYIVLNFASIKKNKSYIANNGTTLKNVVVIENGSLHQSTKKFVKEVGYFSALDKFDNTYQPFDIWTQDGDEFSEIIITFDNEEEFNQLDYILVGGFDRNKNDGKDKRIFEMSEEQN